MRKTIDRSQNIQKLAHYNYKYLKKITASGQETARILDTVKKSTSLKYIHDFEFDP